MPKDSLCCGLSSNFSRTADTGDLRRRVRSITSPERGACREPALNLCFHVACIQSPPCSAPAVQPCSRVRRCGTVPSLAAITNSTASSSQHDALQGLVQLTLLLTRSSRALWVILPPPDSSSPATRIITHRSSPSAQTPTDRSFARIALCEQQCFAGPCRVWSYPPAVLRACCQLPRILGSSEGRIRLPYHLLQQIPDGNWRGGELSKR